MASLAKTLTANSSIKEKKNQKPWDQLLKDYFERSKLEDYQVNPGKISIVAQTPTFTACVISWNEELDRFERHGNHCCEELWTYVVSGEILVEQNDAVDKNGTKQEQLIRQGETYFCCENTKNYCLKGTKNTVSVHVYCTESMNICNNSLKNVVLCNENLSVTDSERGQSISKICKENAIDDRKCSNDTSSIRLFTNFRDLIELLHHEIQPLDSGSFHSPEHIEQICKLLGAVRLHEDEYKRYLRFRKSAYTRNLVGYDVPIAIDGQKTKAKFTVLILCWDKDQMSPIHDHAGSSCWVKVLQGQIREIRYDTSYDPPRVKRDLTLGAEQVCYINDTQGVHSMGNPNPDQVAVSMHIYAPPYILCTLFDNETGKKSVGSMATARIPSNPFAFVPLSDKSEQDDESTPQQESIDLGTFYSKVAPCLDDEEFSKVGSLLESLKLEDHEWQEFVHFDAHQYTRSLVSLDSNFSLMVCCWNSDHATPIHSHGPNVRSWVKVLSGKMQLKKFSGTVGNSVLQDTQIFEEGANLDESLFRGIHILGNASSSEPAVTLHLYSPPFVHMGYLDSNGIDRVIPVVHSATSTSHGRCCAADPIAVCDRVIQKTRSTSVDETKEDIASAIQGIKKSSLVDLLSFFQQQQDKNIFTNLNALARFISIRDVVGSQSPSLVVMCLDRMKINPVEWRQYIKADPSTPRSILLARGPSFRLSICRFDPDTKILSPSSSSEGSWLKILEGELLVAQYLDQVPINSSTVTDYTGVYISGSNKLEQEFTNMSSTRPCFALLLEKMSSSK